MDADLYITYKAGKPFAGCYLGSVFKFSYSTMAQGGYYIGEIDGLGQVVHDADKTIAIFGCEIPDLFTSPKKTGTVACVAKVDSP